MKELTVLREITTHVVNPVNDKLKILVLDEPGAGGANHHYQIAGYTVDYGDGNKLNGQTPILFQNGPIAEKGVNGVTQEALLAIVLDRLQCFQAGPFACDENAEALDHVRRAIAALHKRTKDRVRRGVEGMKVI